MKAADLIREIVKVSEKAACLARAVRAEEALFKLLVQEKTGEEKNKRFVQDFKTLADVLVQQTVHHYLGKQFPSLAAHIHGEESNKFTNVLGETITIEIQSSAQETANILSLVLNGDAEAAKLLAEVVHKNTEVDVDLSSIDSEITIPDGSIGIWIDPIDSTAQYIHGETSMIHDSGVYMRGLQSVLVLIGAYDLTSGIPIIGVVNQPFSEKDMVSNIWEGRSFWGLHYQGISRHSLVNPHDDSTTIVISASESPEVTDILSKHSTLVRASGGGYKLLCAIENLVKCFVLSKGSCFKWDTCGPHAILLSLGGGTLDLRKALDVLRENPDQSDEAFAKKIHEHCQLKYNKPDKSGLSPGQTWSNTGGVLAYLQPERAVEILQILGKSSLHC